MSNGRSVGALAAACLALATSSSAGTLAVPALVNPGFESDAAGVALPAGWTSAGNAAAAFTEAGGYSGGFRLSHFSVDAFSVDTHQVVRGLRDGWYTLKAQVRRSPGTNESYIELDCGREQQRTYLPVSWADQWVQILASARVRRGTCTIHLHSDAAAGEWTNFDEVELARGAARLSVLGVDVSSLKKSEDLGGVYRELNPGGASRENSALRILAQHGASHVRLRVWVDPADGYHDATEVVQMARRARAAGLGVLIDLHYSGSWADPGHQTKPAAWASFSPSELRQAVYDHTYEVCTSVQRRAGAPDLIQIGNELNAGMLWPDGHTYDPPNWENLAAFLTAGYQAVKACSPSTRVVLHLANGGDNGLYRWWFDNVTALGVPFDVIGASYYGFWHGSLGDLQRNLNDVSERYDKDVLVLETAYPFTLEDADGWPNLIGLSSQLVPGYDATPEGQRRNFRDVLSILRAVPHGHGLGAFYWDGTWTAVAGNGFDPADPSSGNAWENQALFDFDGIATPALDELRR